MTRRILMPLLVPLIALLAQGCIYLPSIYPPSEYSEVVLEEGSRLRKILVLDVDGVISSGATSNDGFLSGSDSTVNEVTEKLRKAARDGAVKAVVLRIDSPGGGVTASDVVYRELLDFRQREGIPVYASMLDTAASGGYYIAMAAQRVYAHPTSITGSIGVIAMFPQLERLGNSIGFRMEVIKSGDRKNIGSPFHEMTAEEREILQQVIDEMHMRFREVVAAGRPSLTPERIADLADGRIYTAVQALDAGLVDGINYLPDVVDLIRREHDLPKASVVMYRRTSDDSRDSLYARAPAAEPHAGATEVNLINVDAGVIPRGPVFQYLWLP